MACEPMKFTGHPWKFPLIKMKKLNLSWVFFEVLGMGTWAKSTCIVRRALSSEFPSFLMNISILVTPLKVIS